MKASTSSYVDLQNLYKTKARQDLSVVESLLQRTLKKVGVSEEVVSREEIETFVKHSAFLKVLRGRSLEQEARESKLKGQLGLSLPSLFRKPKGIFFFG